MMGRTLNSLAAASLLLALATAAYGAGGVPRHAYSVSSDKAVSAPGIDADTAEPASDRAARYSDASDAPVPSKRVQAQIARPQALTPASADYSIYDASVALLQDDDADGFHHRFEVRFDADTYFFSADVYARLYLSYQGGPITFISPPMSSPSTAARRTTSTM